MNIINEFEKIYIFRLSIHQDFYEKQIKCSYNYKPINIIKSILYEEDLDFVIDEVNFHEASEKSDIETGTFDWIEELKYPQEHENECIIILDALGEKEFNDSRVQALFKRSKHKNLTLFLISQDYYEHPKRNVPANADIYHIFKTNNFRDVL